MNLCIYHSSDGRIPTPGHARTLLQRQIKATDTAIDTLVYDQYGLTEGEIAIVEGDKSS